MFLHGLLLPPLFGSISLVHVDLGVMGTDGEQLIVGGELDL